MDKAVLENYSEVVSELQGNTLNLSNFFINKNISTLKGQNVSEIQMLKIEILKYKKLEKLYLARNFLGDEGLKVLSEPILMHPNLLVLDLSENLLTRNGIEIITNMFTLLNLLQYLNLEKNPIGNDGLLILANSLIPKNFSLQSLNLSKTAITGKEAIESLNKVLSVNCYLQELNLSQNDLGREGVTSLIYELSKNNFTLKSLNLSHTNFGNIIPALSHFLEVNHSIQSLDLRGSFIGTDGINLLLNALQNNFSLQELHIDSIAETQTQLQKIKQKLEQNKKQTFIHMGLPINWNDLEKKKHLKIIRLLYCKLTFFDQALLLRFTDLKILDLSHNQLQTIPVLTELKSLISLDLSFNNIPYLNILSCKLPLGLQQLRLIGNFGISETRKKCINRSLFLLCGRNPTEYTSFAKVLFWIEIVNDISLEANLEELAKTFLEEKRLDLSKLKLTILPDEIDIFKTIQHLSLSANQFKDFPNIYTLRKLQKLKLKENQLSCLPQEIRLLTSLSELSLDFNKFTEFPSVISNLTHLKRLWMDKNQISNIQELRMINLQDFSLKENSLSQFGSIVNWELLQALFLDGNNISEIPPGIGNLKQLKKLQLDKNKISKIAEEIGELKNLEELKLRENLIVQLPNRIGELQKLTSFDISNNLITQLPPSLVFLTKLQYLNIKGNQIKTPPQEFLINWDKLSGFLKDSLHGSQKCNYVKLIIVGEENVGKTTLVLALRNSKHNLKPVHFTNSDMPGALPLPSRSPIMGKLTNTISKIFDRNSLPHGFSPLSTNGVDISQESLEIKVDTKHHLPNNRLIFNLWDFGGQKVYYSTHAFFLSEKAFYIIVWNVSKVQGEVERVAYWNHVIRSLVKNPIILLIGTHLDVAEELCLDVDKKKEEMAEKTKIPNEFIILVNSYSADDIDHLIEVLVNVGLQTPTVGDLFPKFYGDFKTILSERAKKKGQLPVLEWNELKTLGEECNIFGKEELKRATEFLHSIGYILYFEKDPFLKNYVIIEPSWFAKAIATLISTQSDYIQKGGILDHKQLKFVWANYPPELHSLLLRFMEKFNVAIPISNYQDDFYEGQSVIPALLAEEERPAILRDWSTKELKHKRIYHFPDVFPLDIYPRFISCLLLILGIQPCIFWKDGILIVQNNCECVIKLNNVKQGVVMVYSGNDWFKAFRRVKLTWEMLLKKWEELKIKTYICCPHCLKTEGSSPTSWSYCFEWSECINSNGQNFTCKRSNQTVSVAELIPEINQSDIKLISCSEIFLEEYLGQGTSAEVFQGIYNEKKVAVKKLKIPEIENSEQILREFVHEFEILRNEKHPNLLEVIAMTTSLPWLVVPLAKHGSLFDVLYNPELEWLWPMPLRVSYDIANGMNYLHSLNPPILHCDLRSPNVLIFSFDFKDQVVAKVADFGTSQFSLGRVLLKDRNKVNSNWSAPEVILESDLGTFSDVYSFGCILYEQLTRLTPYDSSLNSDWQFHAKVEIAIIEGVLPPYNEEEIEKRFKVKIPPKFISILKHVWQKDPSKRPSFKTILISLSSLLSSYLPSVTQGIPQIEEGTVKSSTNDLNKSSLSPFSSFESYSQFTKQKTLDPNAPFLSICSVHNKEGTYVMKEFESNELFKHELFIFGFIGVISHPNLIQLVGYLDSPKNNVIILDYVDEIFSFTLLKQKETNKTFSINQITTFSIQILKGLNFLHSKQIAHTNLKASNILVRLSNDNVNSLRLSNFSEAIICQGTKLTKIISERNDMWSAPEVKPQAEINLLSADIWSFGIVLLEIIFTSPPSKDNLEALQNSNLSMLCIPNIEILSDIFKICISFQPIDRPSSSSLLSQFESMTLN